MQQQNQQKQLPIGAAPEDLKGRYSNLMQIAHTQEEFVLDFFNIVAGSGALVARVTLSPGHLKRIVKTLEINFKKYEDKFGATEAAEEPENKIGF